MGTTIGAMFLSLAFFASMVQVRKRPLHTLVVNLPTDIIPFDHTI
jgi:hypothetical protein